MNRGVNPLAWLAQTRSIEMPIQQGESKGVQGEESAGGMGVNRIVRNRLVIRFGDRRGTPGRVCF
jgi:hypothetical protein